MVELKGRVCWEGHLTDYVPIHLRVHLVYKESVHAASPQAVTTTFFFHFQNVEYEALCFCNKLGIMRVSTKAVMK